MSEERPTFVARASDVDALRRSWTEVKEGKARVVRLQAPFGGGRRALSAELLRTLGDDDDAIVWRVQCSDQENGVQWLVRMYGTLVATLTRDTMRRGKVEMVLNGQLPAQPPRVQAWYQQFVAAMKEAKTDKESGQLQLRMPQDNPLVGLVEIAAAIARKIPIVLELQNPWLTHSLALGMFCEALNDEARSSGARVLQILFDEPESDMTRSSYPLPLLDFYERSKEHITVQAIAPWGEEEVKAFLSSRDIEANAGRIAAMARGRPGFVAELAEILKDKDMLESDLANVKLSDLVPLDVKAEELEAPEEPPKEGERTHATTAEVSKVTYFAALLGTAFPSNLVADMGGYDRDSVDDLLDAMPELFEEVQYTNEMQTWIYRFTRGSWREGIVERNDTDEGHELARRVGLFMERYLVPRGYGFIVKTTRIYAEHQAYQRASAMRAMALTQDAPAIWGLAHDFTRYFDEIKYPDALRRTVSMNLLEHLATGGDLDTAEKLQTEVTTWATEKDDRELLAWLLYNGSRIDLRRQDLYRARDRATDSFKLYQALGLTPRSAEVKNHLAAIELQDGNLSAALDAVKEAEELGKVKLEDGKEGSIPGVVATAEQVRGLVARRQGKLDEAIDHFRRANEIAGATGLAPLALDAGLSFGEALLAKRQVDKARDALERVLQIARSLRNPVRERQAAELLAQAEAALRHFDKALPLALRTLELTKALKFDQALPIDLYNAGFFYFVSNKPTEALSYFRQAEDRVAQLGKHPVVKELLYFKGMAHLQAGQIDDAKKSLQAAIKPLQDAKDHRKMVSTLEQLAGIEEKQGDPATAKKLLNDALGLAQQADLKEERKTIKKRLDALA